MACAAVAAVVACSGEPLPSESRLGKGTPAAGPSATTAGAKAPKVDICHRRGNGDYHLINVSENAEPAHLAHGDGKPGETVPGSGGAEVFDAECRVVACELGEPEAVPNEFEEDGGNGTITYTLNHAACGCSAEVASGDDWLSVGAANVAEPSCSVGFTVAAWPEAELGDYRLGSMSTPAGSVEILQLDGDTVAEDINVCVDEPDSAFCDVDGDDGDDTACPDFDPDCD